MSYRPERNGKWLEAAMKKSIGSESQVFVRAVMASSNPAKANTRRVTEVRIRTQ